MATPIRIKRSAVPGKRPTLLDLQLGELAINTYDGRIYLKKDTGISTTTTLVTPWTENVDGSIYYNDGNVVIGTTNPQVSLDVDGNSNISGIVTIGAGNTGISINGTTGIITSISGLTTVTFVGNLTGTASNVIGGIASVSSLSVSGITTVGVLTATKIGIGTTNPTSELFVIGNSDFTGNVNVTSGIITAITASFTDITLGGSVSIGATTGTSGQYLISTGIGVSWSSLPTLRNSFTTTATSNQTTFNVNYNVGFLDVFINGVRLTDSEFTATNGTSFILGESCFGGETVDILAYNTSATGTAPNMVSAPVTSSSSGISGQTAFDSSYFYVCISPNTWKRITLESW